MRISPFKLLFLLFLAPSGARAELNFEDNAFPEFVTSARALALGNAYLCKTDDAWSAFYNPAGLGTVRGPHFHLLNAHGEASGGLMDAADEGESNTLQNYKDTYDPEKLRTMLAQHQGKMAHSRFSFFPNITVRGMAMGYMYSQRNRAIINDDTANEYEIAERIDQGPVFGLNASLFGGVFKIGASAVYLNRRELYDSYGPTEQVDINKSDYKSGKSLQITAGTRLTFPVVLLPTFAAVLRNTTNNDFEGKDPNDGGLPDRIKQTLDLGFSITPQIGKQVRIHIEANFKDVHNKYETSAKRRMAGGIELDINRRIFLRGGYGDGWGSGGLGIRSRVLVFDLTTYAVDQSLDGFREKEDRRYVLSISAGF